MTILITATSPKIRELSDITEANKRAYCEKHNYRFHSIAHLAPNDFSDTQADYASSWVVNLNEIRAALICGMNVLWMDADAWVTDIEKKAEDFNEHGKSLICSHEPAPNDKKINSGVSIWRSNAGGIALIDILLAHQEEWYNEPTVIQRYLNQLRDHWVFGAVRELPPSMMNSIPEMRPEFPQDDPNEIWKQGDWIAHAYGWPLKDKIRMAKTYVGT